MRTQSKIKMRTKMDMIIFERVRDFIARIHVDINLTSWDWPPVQVHRSESQVDVFSPMINAYNQYSHEIS